LFILITPDYLIVLGILFKVEVDHKFLLVNFLFTTETLLGMNANVSWPVSKVEPYQ